MDQKKGGLRTLSAHSEDVSNSECENFTGRDKWYSKLKIVHMEQYHVTDDR